jgi:peptidoglycan hydrolase-like protein with peptidoglycan-binding domain
MQTRRLGNDPQLQKVASRTLTLMRGSQGSGVAQVQDLLDSLGFKLPGSMSRKGADGIFGAETERALKEFQQRNSLKADGVVGPKTLDALEMAIKNRPSLEAPDPLVEAAANRADAFAPADRKRSVYL